MTRRRKLLYFTAHSTLRMLERGLRFGLDFSETKERVLKTLDAGQPAKRHASRGTKTYKRYFEDNLSFFVICEEKKHCLWVRTVIIERGRA